MPSCVVHHFKPVPYGFEPIPRRKVEGRDAKGNLNSSKSVKVLKSINQVLILGKDVVNARPVMGL